MGLYSSTKSYRQLAPLLPPAPYTCEIKRWLWANATGVTASSDRNSSVSRRFGAVKIVKQGLVQTEWSLVPALGTQAEQTGNVWLSGVFFVSASKAQGKLKATPDSATQQQFIPLL